MKTILTNNISKRTIEDGNGPWTPPPLPWGVGLTIGLRFLQDVTGGTVEPSLNIHHMKAALGKIDARPESGTWKLKMGGGAVSAGVNTTAAMPYNVTPAALKAAINAVSSIATWGTVGEVLLIDGSYRIKFGGANQVTLTVVSNRLWPVSFGRVTAYQQDAEWYHEVRLTQAPVDFEDSGERILPPPPTVSSIQVGGSGGGYDWNDVQQLYVPINFRGTYILRYGDFARTGELSLADTAASVQRALEAILGAGNVKATLIADQTTRIEFTNELAGAEQPVLTVEPLNPPPGDYTFTIPLDRWELLAILRKVESVTLPLDVEIWVTEGSGEDAVVVPRAGFRVNVTILRPLIWPDMALVPGVNWQRPPSPRSYIPFSPDSVITGQQFYTEAIGNGASVEFTVDHGLATDIVYVFVRENHANGSQLRDGIDFTAYFPDDNSVVISAIGDFADAPPATNDWMVTVVSAQTVAAFAEDLTVEIGQVNGLEEILAALGDQLTALLALAPTTPLVASTTGSGPILTMSIPDAAEVFPTSANGTRVGGLLPAIHNATVTSYASGDLPDPTTHGGYLYRNNSGGPIVIPGGQRLHSSTLANGDYFGSDGRMLYALTHYAGVNSNFPKQFEREIFFREVSAQMLRAGTRLTLNFTLTLALIEALTRAQYMVVLEHGTAPSQSSPATTRTNLQDIVWNATPLFKQRVILGVGDVPHALGAEIIRAANGTLSANKIAYGASSAADAVPASADVALRVRLLDFDTENSVSLPKGAVSWKLTGASLVISK